MIYNFERIQLSRIINFNKEILCNLEFLIIVSANYFIILKIKKLKSLNAFPTVITLIIEKNYATLGF